MVRVYADGELVYTPHLDGYELLGLKATQSADKAGTAEIIIPYGHPGFAPFNEYKSLVEIYRDDDLLFRGRSLYKSVDLHMTRTITCEGERCFLRDSVIEPYLYQASPAVIFSDLIARHNAQVDDFKKFQVGTITAEDPNGYVRLESEEAELTADVVDKLVERVGGYIRFTTDGSGQRVINWLGSLDNVSSQTIRIGDNLLDFSTNGANTDLATVIWPYGAKDETTGKRVTIETVNDGKRYIEDAQAVFSHGRIAKPVYWDDVTRADNLLRKAQQYLAKSKLVVTTIELTAVDLSLLDTKIETLRVGDNVLVISSAHRVYDHYLLRERTYDLLNPSADRVVLGAERATMTNAGVRGDKNSLNQIHRSGQSIKTDYKISITDALARATNK